MTAVAKKLEVGNSSLIKYILNGHCYRELVRSLSLCEFIDIEDLFLKIKRYMSIQDRVKFEIQMRSTNSFAYTGRPEQHVTDCLPHSQQRDRKVRCCNCQSGKTVGVLITYFSLTLSPRTKEVIRERKIVSKNFRSEKRRRRVRAAR